VADSVVWEDERRDLALLSLFLFPPPLPFGSPKSPPLGEDESPAIGTTVYAIGSPLGLGNSLSEGIISGKREVVEGVWWLQTTAPISAGSSGGPLLSVEGKVLGVTAGSLAEGQNLNFAVPASEIRRLLAQPCNARPIWQGTSIHEEDLDAFGRLLTWSFTDNRDASDAVKRFHEGIDCLGKQKNEDAIKAFTRAADAGFSGEFEYYLYYELGEAYYGAFRNQLKGARLSQKTEDLHQFAQNNVHHRKAIQAFDKAIRLNPRFSPAYDSLVTGHHVSGAFPEALLAADALVKLVPRCSEAYRKRGECFDELDRPEAALKDFRRAVGLAPSNPKAQCFLGRGYLAAGDYDKAIQASEAALRLNYEPALMCYVNIGTAHKKARRYEKALAAFEQARSAGAPAFICDAEIAECRARMR
jgi:tetratricopeptide (TPR) repeat protein